MTSALAWLDFSERDQRRTREIIQLHGSCGTLTVKATDSSKVTTVLQQTVVPAYQLS